MVIHTPHFWSLREPFTRIPLLHFFPTFFQSYVANKLGGRNTLSDVRNPSEGEIVRTVRKFHVELKRKQPLRRIARLRNTHITLWFEKHDKVFKDAGTQESLFCILQRVSKRHLFSIFLGEMWYVLVPLAQSLIYFFLITILFEARAAKHHNFSFILMGIMHYSLFFQVSGLVLPSVYNGGQILLQVKLNPIVLITSAFCRALQNWVIGVIIFLLYFVIFEDLISYRILIYPFVLLILAYFCWVLGVILATLAVYLRDLEKIMPIIFQVLMYLSPVIYPVSFYPEGFSKVLLLTK